MGTTDSKSKPSTTKDKQPNTSDISKGQPHQIVSPTTPGSHNFRSLRTHKSRTDPKNEDNKNSDNTNQRNKNEDNKDEDNINDVPTSFEIQPINLKRQEYNPFITDMRIYTGKHDDNKVNIDDNKQPDNIDIEPLIGSFEFGELFGYWDSKSSTKKYITPQHKSLKDEVTNNKNEIYINEEAYNEFLQKAKHKHKLMYDTKGNNIAIYAKNKPYWNQLFQIKPGSKMSIDHIMALILFTDSNDLSLYMSQQGRQIDTETQTDFAVKNRKYANWFRLLFEVVWLYGNDLQYDQMVYNGLSNQYLFKQFQRVFNTPLSTTRRMDFAAQLARSSGVILGLRNPLSTPQSYFATEKFSAYPMEKEYLFYGSTLQITFIMASDENTSNKNYLQVDVLNFYLQLINGNEIETCLSTYSPNSATHIKQLSHLCRHTLELILQHQKCLRDEDLGDFDQGYMWKSFINFTNNNNIIWINKNKLRYLQQTITCNKDENIQLVNQFVMFGEDRNDELGEYLQLLLAKNSNMKVLYVTEWEWIVNQKELNALRKGTTGKNGIVCADYWDYFIDNKNKICTFGGNMVVGFQNDKSKQKDEVRKVGFYWRLSNISNKYKHVMVSVELYCPQIEFYTQFVNIKMCMDHRWRNHGHKSLFPVSMINKLKAFNWRIIMKCEGIEI
eukprot:182537_1